MKKFREIATGNVITVVNVDKVNDLAIMDNGNKINWNALIDDSQYREVNDINESYNKNNNVVMSDNVVNFDDNSRYNSLLSNIKNINTSIIQDDPNAGKAQVSVNSVFDSDSVVNRMRMNQPSQQTTTSYNIDDEQAILRKAEQAEAKRIAALHKQNELLSKFVDEEDIANFNSVSVSTQQPTQHINSFIPEYDNYGNIINQPPSVVIQPTTMQHNQPSESAYSTLLKNIKKTKSHTLNLKYTVQIPDKSVLKMLNESFEVSIIDILTEEYFNNIINDKELIREQLKSALNDYISSKK